MKCARMEFVKGFAQALINVEKIKCALTGCVSRVA
jgi:hypothetical protein